MTLRPSADEVVLVEGLLALDDASVVRRLSGRGQRDPLGFGVTEVAARWSRRWCGWCSTRWPRPSSARPPRGHADARAVGCGGSFTPPLPPVVLPPLDRAQLAEVHQRVVEAAIQRGVTAERTRELADAVVAALVLAEPDSPPPDDPEEAGDPAGGDPR